MTLKGVYQPSIVLPPVSPGFSGRLSFGHFLAPVQPSRKINPTTLPGDPRRVEWNFGSPSGICLLGHGSHSNKGRGATYHPTPASGFCKSGANVNRTHYLTSGVNRGAGGTPRRWSKELRPSRDSPSPEAWCAIRAGRLSRLGALLPGDGLARLARLRVTRKGPPASKQSPPRSGSSTCVLGVRVPKRVDGVFHPHAELFLRVGKSQRSRRVANRQGRGGPRPGSGAKPIPADRRRSRLVSTRLTPNEYEALRRASGDTGLSDYLRELIVRHLARRR